MKTIKRIRRYCCCFEFSIYPLQLRSCHSCERESPLSGPFLWFSALTVLIAMLIFELWLFGKKKMTRNELISKISESHPSLIQKDVDASVRLILDTISNHLAKGDRVEIRGFGAFCLNEVPPRIGRNPKTGEKVNVPAKTRVYFKAGKELRERVDFQPKG